jgi:hypothetical protein
MAPRTLADQHTHGPVLKEVLLLPPGKLCPLIGWPRRFARDPPGRAGAAHFAD